MTTRHCAVVTCGGPRARGLWSAKTNYCTVQREWEYRWRYEGMKEKHRIREYGEPLTGIITVSSVACTRAAFIQTIIRCREMLAFISCQNAVLFSTLLLTLCLLTTAAPPPPQPSFTLTLIRTFHFLSCQTKPQVFSYFTFVSVAWRTSALFIPRPVFLQTTNFSLNFNLAARVFPELIAF